jgi:hypothetical protein
LFCCILDPFLQPGRWRRECEPAGTVLQEYPQVDPARRGLRLSFLEESCKLHGRLAQSPSRGLWPVGGLDEARCDSATTEGWLEPRVVVLH